MSLVTTVVVTTVGPPNKYERIFRKAVVKKNMADKNIYLRVESETEEEFESVEEEETDDTMPQGTSFS